MTTPNPAPLTHGELLLFAAQLARYGCNSPDNINEAAYRLTVLRSDLAAADRIPGVKPEADAWLRQLAVWTGVGANKHEAAAVADLLVLAEHLSCEFAALRAGESVVVAVKRLLAQGKAAEDELAAVRKALGGFMACKAGMSAKEMADAVARDIDKGGAAWMGATPNLTMGSRWKTVEEMISDLATRLEKAQQVHEADLERLVEQHDAHKALKARLEVAEGKLAAIAQIDPELKIKDEVELVQWLDTQTRRWESVAQLLGICATKDPPDDIAGFIDTRGGGKLLQDALRAEFATIKSGNTARVVPDLHDVLAHLCRQRHELQVGMLPGAKLADIVAVARLANESNLGVRLYVAESELAAAQAELARLRTEPRDGEGAQAAEALAEALAEPAIPPGYERVEPSRPGRFAIGNRSEVFESTTSLANAIRMCRDTLAHRRGKTAP